MLSLKNFTIEDIFTKLFVCPSTNAFDSPLGSAALFPLFMGVVVEIGEDSSSSISSKSLAFLLCISSTKVSKIKELKKNKTDLIAHHQYHELLT